VLFISRCLNEAYQDRNRLPIRTNDELKGPELRELLIRLEEDTHRNQRSQTFFVVLPGI
jgi:hypothetical protein